MEMWTKHQHVVGCAIGNNCENAVWTSRIMNEQVINSSLTRKGGLKHRRYSDRESIKMAIFTRIRLNSMSVELRRTYTIHITTVCYSIVTTVSVHPAV